MAENEKNVKSENLDKLSRWFLAGAFLMLNMAIIVSEAELYLKFILFGGLWFISAIVTSWGAETEENNENKEQVNNRRTIKDYPQYKS